jgi:hypothetical protein
MAEERSSDAGLSAIATLRTFAILPSIVPFSSRTRSLIAGARSQSFISSGSVPSQAPIDG